MSCGNRLLELVRGLDRRPPRDLSDSWRSLGVDSLDLLVLVTQVEDEFDVDLPDGVVAGAATVADLAAAVDERRSG
jgi:acyl carrier protein